MRNTKIALLGLVIVVSSVAGFVSQARAEPDWIVGRPSDARRMTDLSFGSGLAGGRGFAATPGVMLGIPILDSGFIRPVNDAIFLEPGLFLGVRNRHDDTYLWVIPEFGPRWNFYLTPNWDVFGAIKAGWAIGSHGNFWLRGTVGMQWWFARPWALRLESAAGSIGPGIFAGMSYQFL